MVIEWSNFDSNIGKIVNISAPENRVLKLLRPAENSTFNGHNPKDIKLFTKLRLINKLNHGLRDKFNLFSNCGKDTKSTNHYIFQCPPWFNERVILLE